MSYSMISLIPWLFTLCVWCLLMICFHKIIWALLLFECWWLCDFHVSRIFSCFILFLKDFVLVYKFIIKLVVYSSRSRVSNILSYFQTHIFENPYHRRAVGWTIMPCMLKIEYSFNMCMNRMVGMSYTLDPHYIFNWYHNWYVHVCILICVFLYMYASNFK